MFVYLWIFMCTGVFIFRVGALDEDDLKPCFERYENAKITDSVPFHTEWRMKNEEACLKFCAKTTSRCRSIVYDRYSHVCHYFMDSGIKEEKIIKNTRMTYFELVDTNCALEKIFSEDDQQDVGVPAEQSIPSPPVEIDEVDFPSEPPTWVPSSTEPVTDSVAVETISSVSTIEPEENTPKTLGSDETVFYPNTNDEKMKATEEKPPTYEDYQDLLNSLPDYDQDSKKKQTTPEGDVPVEEEVLVEPVEKELSTKIPKMIEVEPGVEEIKEIEGPISVDENETPIEGPISVDENKNPIEIEEEEATTPNKYLTENKIEPPPRAANSKKQRVIERKKFDKFKPVITPLNSEFEGAAILPAMNVFKASQRHPEQNIDSTETKLEKILKKHVEIRRRPISHSTNPKEQHSAKNEAYLSLIRRLVEKLDQLPEQEPERVQAQHINTQSHFSSRSENHTRRVPVKNIPSVEKVDSIEVENNIKKFTERPEPVLVRPVNVNERLVVPQRARELQNPMSPIKIVRPKAVPIEDEEPTVPIPLKLMENSKLKMKIEKTQNVELITEETTTDTVNDDDCPKDFNHIWIAVENSKISESTSQTLRKNAHAASDCMEICNNLVVGGARCNSFTFNEIDRICKFYADEKNISVEPASRKDFKTRAFRRLCFPTNLSPFYQCSEFLSFREFSMNINPREEFEGLPSNITGFSACAELCVLSPDFKCLSASFDFSNQKCRVYDKNSVTDPYAFREHSVPNMLYFENGCQNQEISTAQPESMSVQRVQQRLRPIKIDYKKRVKRV